MLLTEAPFSGSWVFSGFGRGSNTPVPSFISSLLLKNIPFSILLISWWMYSGANLFYLSKRRLKTNLKVF